MSKNKVILMKVTSRGRPEELIRCIQSYLDMAQNTKDMVWLFSFDADDDKYMLSRIDNKLAHMIDKKQLHVVFGTSTDKINAINRDVNELQAKWDILLNISDDQLPIVKNYDEHIRQIFNAYGLDKSLWYSDGHQDKINTMEVVGFDYYQRDKFIYDPRFKSFFCDNLATEVANKRGCLIKNKQCIIEHIHPGWVAGKMKYDELYKRNDTYWNEDKETYARIIKDPTFHIRKPRLSILIATIEEREAKFKKLYDELSKQKAELNEDVQILFESDNKEISVGAKRQSLLLKSTGDYICYIDDDDRPSHHYIKMLLKGIAHNPDCIGFLIECDMDGKKCMAKASNEYEEWAENIDSFRYVRTIYHKTPVRRDIALQIGFKDMRYGEDGDYSTRLKQSGLLKKEAFINSVLYYYNYSSQNCNENQWKQL